MKFDFLSRLFSISSCERSVPLKTESFEALYQRIPEVEIDFDAFNSVLDTLGIEDMDGTISDAVCILVKDHEKQGFINGIRMGMMLAGELRQVENGQIQREL